MVKGKSWKALTYAKWKLTDDDIYGLKLYQEPERSLIVALFMALGTVSKAFSSPLGRVSIGHVAAEERKTYTEAVGFGTVYAYESGGLLLQQAYIQGPGTGGHRADQAVEHLFWKGNATCVNDV